MEKTLVIAEKPAAGRDIAEALGVNKKIDGAMENDKYIVTWATGHLVTLKEPDEYRDEWKKWSMNTLPIIPEQYELKVTDNGKKQFYIIKKFLTSKNVSMVVNACDAGREGELIFDYIYRLSGSKISAFRLWTSAALTKEAINREFGRLKPIEEFNGLRLAARARAVADWSIGMNATRAITLAAQSNEPKPDPKSKQKNNVFSVGRVQTPTLQFIVSREREILDFKSVPFWTINVEIITKENVKFKARYEYKKEKTFTHQIFSKIDAEKIVNNCKGKESKVVKVDSKDNSMPPPLLFDLTELQKECNKRFSLSADKTLQITQSLYEKHKCISYPRTEYRHLTEDNREGIPKILSSLEGNFEHRFIKFVKQNFKKENKRIFDGSKVGDHHALIPTTTRPKNLNEIEHKVYKLIVNRFLCVFAPNFDFQSSIIASQCGTHLFVARGFVIKNYGWKSIEKDIADEDDKPKDSNEQKLPNLSFGDMVKIEGLNIKEEKTKPPLRYTDATILSAMQNPSLKAENEDDKDLLKQCGLGTPATRAAIIKNLEDKGYIEREKKNLKPTQKSFNLMNMLEKYNQKFLGNPILTAELEKGLQEIERDPKKAFLFLDNLNLITKDIVSKINNYI